jgi:hypothetical protein
MESKNRRMKKNSRRKNDADGNDGSHNRTLFLRVSMSDPSNNKKLNFSKKLGPHTEKVFYQVAKAGVFVDCNVSGIVRNNETLIDDMVQDMIKSNGDVETFLLLVIWKIVEIARSNWDIKDGKAVHQNKCIITLDHNMKDLLEFCDKGGDEEEQEMREEVKCYEKAMVKEGRWLTHSSFSRALREIFHLPVVYEAETDRQHMDLDLDRVSKAAAKKGIEQQFMAKLLEDIYKITNLDQQLLASQPSTQPRVKQEVMWFPDHILVDDYFTIRVYQRLLEELNMNESPPSTSNSPTFKFADSISLRKPSNTGRPIPAELFEDVVRSWMSVICDLWNHESVETTFVA